MVTYKHAIFIILLFTCTHYQGYAQTTLYQCNNKYKIELSNTLELQSSELNTTSQRKLQGNKTQTNIVSPTNHIVFQQKGLNNNVKTAYNKYCRVLIDYYTEDKREPVYGRGEQVIVDKDIIEYVHKSVNTACTRNRTPLIKLNTIQPISINGFPVLYYSYKRKGWENSPPVIVNTFQIFNRYESVVLTFSYRESERELWKSIHTNILRTFTFIKKY